LKILTGNGQIAVFKIPVVPEIAETGGYVTAYEVGVARDFLNDLFLHRESRLTAISQLPLFAGRQC
jgi:hypothetical protein